jgi:hypothetical protein
MKMTIAGAAQSGALTQLGLAFAEGGCRRCADVAAA